MLTVALLLTVAHAKNASQSHFALDKGDREWTVRYTFADERGARRSVEAALPATAIQADNQVSLSFPKEAAAKAQVAAVRRYAEAHGGPKIKAKEKNGGVSLRVTGRNRAKMEAALAGAEAAAAGELELWLARHRYTRLKNDAIVPDHARLAVEYADDVAPLARALAVDSPDARTYAERALAFVQAIPYEIGKGGADKVYRRPLSVLARNKGDCDSKSTLYLALLRAEHPELASTVVYVPNHAFVGLALEPQAGDRTFVRNGVTYVGAEPVGPARAETGKVSGRSGWHLFWGSAQDRALSPAD